MIPEYFAYLSIPFIAIGSFFYIRDTIRGKTKPNRVSWIFWMIAPFVGVYIGYKSGVSLPLLASTFAAGFCPFLVLIASIFNKNSYWKTTKFDILCGILSLIAIIIWVTTKNGAISITFAVLADLFASIPTIIKSWKHSETENIGPYSFGTINQIITILAISKFSFLNLIFPIYFILDNIIIILGVKRKSIFKLITRN
ncbi:MAG: hypothetical protein WC908_01755 [Candidatus Paceibacterota bacterium]